MLSAFYSPVLSNVSIKSCVVYLILLKGNDVLIQLLFDLSASCSIESVGVGEIGSMELEVRRVVYKEFFQRNCNVIIGIGWFFCFFTHVLPGFYDGLE